MFYRNLVRFGEYDTSTEADGAQQIDVQILSKRVHENFKFGSFDIAIVKLSKKIRFNGNTFDVLVLLYEKY